MATELGTDSWPGTSPSTRSGASSTCATGTPTGRTPAPPAISAQTAARYGSVPCSFISNQLIKPFCCSSITCLPRPAQVHPQHPGLLAGHRQDVLPGPRRPRLPQLHRRGQDGGARPRHHARREITLTASGNPIFQILGSVAFQPAVNVPGDDYKTLTSNPVTFVNGSKFQGGALN